MIEFITKHIDTIGILISAFAALLTAVATFFLWRVTRLLADETKRMVDASAQPHVVVTLEPNPWVAFYFDINIANTGNAPAYNIEVLFDPPLVNAEHRINRDIPFSNVSVLKNGHSLNSSLCKYEQIKDQVYLVSISWSKHPGSSEREKNEYSYDMASFEGVSYLGARNPMTQIAEQMKKLREDWRPVSQGNKKIKSDVYSQDDRNEDLRLSEERYREFLREREQKKGNI
ncbi:hypothetical protein [Biostraticola tofi]|uniref:Uncharacterized protein n=1 Tax=Biostraticola tofi TaxID=466109 RepID=A0A4R3YI07_9GAMM|nr:hypothetical protein [Biostraticola tofi]TCV91721.1 hypothetical protein EDC52_11543 [Biostraticola tofi]